MQWKEFEQLTGKRVSFEEFTRWEKMYMAADVCKEAFCKAVKRFVREEPETLPKTTVAKCTAWRMRCGVVWYLVEEFYVKDIDVATGKYRVFRLFDNAREMTYAQICAGEWSHYFIEEDFDRACEVVKRIA